MDRRQRKTREAIFNAFTALLSEKDVNKITVGEIIERADIGRATFYAHFETKDFLLKALCEELFCHIFDSTQNGEHRHKHIFECDAPDSVFLHLFQHLKKNDNHISELLTSENNHLFLEYFKTGLIGLIENLPFESDSRDIPREFLINHVAATFVETVRWWFGGKEKLSTEEIYKYFLSVLKISDI